MPQAADAAAIIWKLWQSGEVTEALPDQMRPATRAEGYAIQAHLEKYSAKPRYGWKIAATSKAGQQHIGVDGPIAGRLLAERIHPPGATVSIKGNRMLVAEPEFAFSFARDMAPRPTPYTQAEVMDSVADLHLALELPDSRFADFAAVGGMSLIADNACARDFVIGPAVTAPWRGLDLSKHPVHARVGSRYERDGVGSNVLGDPRIALTWLVNEVTGLGITIGKGEIVPTGICMIPLAIQSGDHVHADYGPLGTIDMTVAA
ncbi:MAG TPA: hydratase [Hyphomicrobiaceae bacterium]|nr:hydratase [Hyphomicrobiaceae bacterium]